jgi:hypothetical protein
VNHHSDRLKLDLILLMTLSSKTFEILGNQKKGSNFPLLFKRSNNSDNNRAKNIQVKLARRKIKITL